MRNGPHERRVRSPGGDAEPRTRRPPGPDLTVVVVGGGIAGLGVARGLARRGVEVVVVERGTVGCGATWGSAGWICPLQAGPLPEPGLVGYGLRSLFDRESALYIRPSALPRMIGWLTRFARACNESAHHAGVGALSVLGYRAFPLVDELIAEGAEFALYKRGLLAVAASEESVVHFLRGLEAARALGYDVPSTVLDAEALHELEPSLSGALRHGLSIRDHWHVDSGEMATAIGTLLRKQGVAIEERVTVEGVVIERGRARAVRTSSGVIDADIVVLAAGAWTTPLAKTVGVRLPVVGGKGYSFRVRPETMPTRAILFLEPHAVCTPLGDTLRVAGTMEFSGLTSSIDTRRVETIKRQVRPLVGWDEGTEGEPWAGLRPIAPDGLPVVGRIGKRQNVYVATGYAMLGITLGLPAGEALAQQITDGREDVALATFSPARFRRSGA